MNIHTCIQVTYAGLVPRDSTCYQCKYLKQEIFLKGNKYEISQIFGLTQKGIYIYI